MNYLNKIKDLVKYLNKKDINIAEDMLKSRDFDGLLELSTSAILRYKKALKCAYPDKNDYEGINLEKLEALKAIIILYRDLVDPATINSTEEEDYEEIE